MTVGAVPVDGLDDRTVDGFVRHRCVCRFRTVLGTHGFDESGRFCYKIVIRDRVVIIYFGAFVVICKDCKRWSRVRVLPKERKAEITALKTPPASYTEIPDDDATLAP